MDVHQLEDARAHIEKVCGKCFANIYNFSDVDSQLILDLIDHEE